MAAVIMPITLYLLDGEANDAPAKELLEALEEWLRIPLKGETTFRPFAFFEDALGDITLRNR
ncbi:hypothetical protein DDR56_06225 [Halomonas venusta]|uniref:Uncharacterized protein n=2 Tax=Vreelandella venusta TaxID=44935 RepID=A0ABX2B7S3_9GAMM|nr:hypothetical protein [Halomonas venusta]